MKALIVIPNLGSGGAERNAVNLANLLQKNSAEVLILRFLDDQPFYNTVSEIRMESCGVAMASRTGLSFKLSMAVHAGKCLKTIRKTIREFHPDIVISFLKEADILVWLARLGKSFPWAASERNDPATRTLAMQYLLKKIYKDASLMIFQTQGTADCYPGVRKKAILPNLMDLQAFPDPDDETAPLEIVTAGRLVPAKNHSLLLQAYRRALPDLKHDTRLVIYGAGPLQEELEKQIRNMNLVDKVSLRPPQRDLLKRIRNAAVYVCSSDYEGYSNALTEAVLMGLPVISTDCRTGSAAELIDPDTGILVPCGNEASLTEALITIINNDNMRRHMRLNNRARRKTVPEMESRWLNALYNAAIKTDKTE